VAVLSHNRTGKHRGMQLQVQIRLSLWCQCTLCKETVATVTKLLAANGLGL